MNKTESGVIQRIEEKYPALSKGQKRIGDYITAHIDKAAFMTASRLAQEAGVSESTVVRFAIELEYTGYPQLHRALQEVVRGKLTTVQRMGMSDAMYDEEDLLARVLKADMVNIRRTLDEIDPSEFGEAVNSILEAEHVYVLGMRSAALLSDYLCHYLSFLLPNVASVNPGTRDIFEQLLRVGPKDVLIAVSFPRYSRRTVEAAEFVARRGGRVIALTDSAAAPVAAFAHRRLIAGSNMASFVDSLVAPLSVVNALIVAVSMRRKEETESSFDELERIWAKYGVYTNGTEVKL